MPCIVVSYVSSPPPNPQGMQKNSSSLQLGTSYEQVTGMELRPTFEATFSSDGLVIPKSGSWDLSAAVNWAASTSANDRKLKIMKNGVTQLGEWTSGFVSHTTISGSLSNQVLAQGDVLTIWAQCGGVTSTRVVAAGSGTFLTATPVI